VGGLQSHLGRGGEEKNSQALSRLEPAIIQPVAHTRDFKEMGYAIVDWIYLVQDIAQWRALVSTVIDLHVQ